MILLHVLQFVTVILILKLIVYSCFHVAQSQEATSLNFSVCTRLHMLMLEKHVLLIGFFTME